MDLSLASMMKLQNQDRYECMALARVLTEAFLRTGGRREKGSIFDLVQVLSKGLLKIRETAVHFQVSA